MCVSVCVRGREREREMIINLQLRKQVFIERMQTLKECESCTLLRKENKREKLTKKMKSKLLTFVKGGLMYA